MSGRTAVTLRASGRADPGTVWERYARPALWSGWSPQIRGVRTEGERIVPGMTGEVVTFLGVRVPFTVETVDEARRAWTWRARLGPVTVRLHHTVTARPGGGTATVLRAEGAAPVVAAYAVPAYAALRRLVRPRP
ncbi:SRPBCC family protein [Streptomyces avicenniae]|uniref:SRPBCC family protein n=1 Tax=Streptomyces avicenniae TaxID=500153 RepID=UPI001CBA61AD|nr:SRPBCC family protein [Streptomyces avicenniae]